MELRHLRSFIAIADQGTFTRAAETLHIAQPPLSHTIQDLERELGLKLFTRSRRGAALTDAGSQLLGHARAILALEEQFRGLARGIATGERGRLRIGMAGALTLLPLVSQAVRDFRERWPDITLTLEESNTPALCEALHRREVDIALVRPPAPDPSVALHPLFDEPTVLALPEGHRLSKRRALRLSDVAEEPFLIFERALGPGFYDAIIAACRDSGFTPRLGQPAAQITAAIPMVAAGMGVSVVPAYLSQIRAQGATFHPITGPSPRATISLASRDVALEGPAARFHDLILDIANGNGT